MQLKHDTSREIVNHIERTDEVRAQLEELRAHHEGTLEHSRRVAALAADIGIEEGLSEHDVRLLGMAGLLHDVGKRDIDKRVLEKPARLSEGERAHIAQHPRHGFARLAAPIFDEVKRIVVGHHEYKKDPYPRGQDASTYPYSGKDRRAHDPRITKLTEILAAADIFDALFHPRDYKPALSPARVEEIMREQYRGDARYIERVMHRAG